MIFNRTYFILTCVLFIIEVYIALFVHDTIIRPYLGDFLVMLLMYCYIRAFFPFPINNTLVIISIFALLVEFSQYFQLLHKLELEQFRVAKMILGQNFSWADIGLYLLGVVFIYGAEKIRN